jgi:hypothetical protein
LPGSARAFEPIAAEFTVAYRAEIDKERSDLDRWLAARALQL